MKRPAIKVTWVLALLVIGLLLCLTIWRQGKSVSDSHSYGSIILIIPDDMDNTTPEVRIWTDAANERGVLLKPLQVSDWLRGVNYTSANGPAMSVIVPDTFHRQMSEAAVQTIYRVVEAGGNAMIVQDAGILDERGSYAHGPSRFSRLVGVEYGNYEQYKEQLSHYDEILGAPATMELLGIPPGRYLNAQEAVRLSKVDSEEIAHLDKTFSTLVAGYTKDTQRFALLKTSPATPQETLLRSTEKDTAASIHNYGKGKAVFVNLPLTYLMQRTDGIFLHGFLSYFASQVIGMPQLQSTPNGRGALVLNWHNDDGRAIGFLQQLQEAGIFDHGHQSMHFTAGPDVDEEGDQQGMDLENNQEAMDMIQKLRAQGHTIGNHGGWIHNFFGHNANDQNGEEFVQYLDKNNEAVSRANGGQAPKEYSAPLGNQPLWVYDWMEQQGVQAYYMTGNIGMAPTRVWMGKRRMGSAWAFPVTTYGQVASAEEASFQKMPVAEFDGWLQQMARFIEQQGAMRLSYFHPIGAVLYLPAVKNYIETLQACVDREKCQFISMSEAAEFLTRREQTQWSLQHQDDSDILSAQHPTSMAALTWRIPANTYTDVRIRQGEARVEHKDSHWQVTVQSGTAIELELRRKSATP